MSKIHEAVRGKSRIEIIGAFPESALNAAAIDAIELWELECVDDNTLRANIYQSEQKRFEAIAQRCMCQVTLLESKGGQENMQRLKRRYPFLILSLLMALLLFLSSLFIWEIDVRGNEKLSRGEILRALEDCGVKSGTYWPGVSSDLVRSKMLGILPDLGWMALNVNGSRAVALIVERQEKPEIYSPQAAADIIAKKTGIIRRISVLNGKAAVAPGQAALKGELLISGTMDDLSGGSRYVCAKAEVLADTWYELTAVTPETESMKSGGGISHSRFAVIFGERRINLYFGSGNTIDECDKIIHEYKLGIDGLFALPVTILREEYRGYSLTDGPEQRRDEMKAKLAACLSERVDGDIISQSFTGSSCGGRFILTLRAHCLEDIGELIHTAE